MKKIIRALILYIVLSAVLFLNGCGLELGSKSQKETMVYVYYLQKDSSGIEREAIDVTGDTNVLETLLEALGTPPLDAGLKKTLGSDTKLVRHELSERQLLLYFDEDYDKLSKIDEVLFRAAVTKTMCQVKEVEGVNFFVGDEPCKDMYGQVIGAMTPDSFVDTSMDSMGSYNRVKLTLYFASEDGKSLVKEERNVAYSTNVALEKIIVEQLLKGTAAKGMQASLSEARKINSVSVKDGICYVDISDIVLDDTATISEEVSVYSIVNSLTELDYINKVQVLIDGESQRTFRGQISLDQPFERKL